MADVSETVTGDDQISITVEAELPPHHNPPQSPINNAEADRRAVFKVGLLMCLIALGGIFNPPIGTMPTTTIFANRVREVLSIAFDVAIFFNLCFGITQILISILLRPLPGLITISVANKMTQIGIAVMRVTLGFGTSLVLVGVSSSWLALYIVFISIQFLM